MRKTKSLCICCAALLAALATSASAVTYQIRQLSDHISWASGINNAGVIAATAYDQGVSHAAVVDELGLLALLDEGFAVGINNSGCVVGSAGRAAMWSPAGVLSYLPLPSDATFSQALGINDAGVAVGECWLGTPHVTNYITVWNGDADPLILGEGCGIGINSVGAVVGFTKGPGGEHRAFVWTPTGGMTALAGGVSSEARAVNSAGEVAGAICDGLGTWACKWSAAGDLMLLDNIPGTIASTAFGLNGSGAAVGFCETAEGALPVLWQPDGSVVVLEWLTGDVGGTAYAINDFGLIAGCSLDSSYNPRAVVWEPVPEPAGVLAMLAGLVALMPRLRNRSSA